MILRTVSSFATWLIWWKILVREVLADDVDVAHHEGDVRAVDHAERVEQRAPSGGGLGHRATGDLRDHAAERVVVLRLLERLLDEVELRLLASAPSWRCSVAPVTAVFSPGQRNVSIAAIGSAYSGSSRTGSSHAIAVGTAQNDFWPSSKMSQPFLFWRALRVVEHAAAEEDVLPGEGRRVLVDARGALLGHR